MAASTVGGRRDTALATRVATQAREEAVGPASAVEILDALRHRLEAALPLARRQLERGGELLDDAVDVPRVDEERAGEDLRGAGELREQERAAPAARKPWLGLAEHELLRDEVHPVAQRRDHHHVGAAVERDEPLLRDVAMDVLDRRHARPPELAVDAGDEELDLVPLRAVVRAVEPRRHDAPGSSSSSAPDPDPARGSARTRGASAECPSCSRGARPRARVGGPRTDARDRQGAAPSRDRR